MYFNHATAGALAIKPVIKKYENIFTEKEINVLWFIGITSAILPDLDIAYSVIKNLEDHRSFVTHGLFIYLVAFMIFYLLSYFQKRNHFGRKFFKVASFVFLLGVLTHLVIDFFAGGIALFAPFYSEVIGFDMGLNHYSKNRLAQYLLSKYMILEIFLFVLFIKKFKGKENFIPKLFSIFYVIVAIISFIFVGLNFFSDRFLRRFIISHFLVLSFYEHF